MTDDQPGAEEPGPSEESGPSEDPGPEALTTEQRAERRRRLAKVFGDVLPEQTSDDADGPQEPGGDSADAWLRDQVPPHHG